MTLRIAALASGRGSNVGTIIRHCQNGAIDGEVVQVLCNRPGAPVIDLARKAGVPVWCKSHTEAPNRESFDQEMLTALTEAKADLIVLAGYMRLLSSRFIAAFPNRIINVHPSLLPAFTGAHAPDEAEAYGVCFSGCSVHFVEEALDSGPIIVQAAVAVRSGEKADDFMPRVHALEHRILPQAIQWIAENRLAVNARHVTLLPPPGPARNPLPGHGLALPEGAMVSPPLEGF